MNKIVLKDGTVYSVTNESGLSFSFTGTKPECDAITDKVISQGKNTIIKYTDAADVVFATYGNLTFSSSNIKAADGAFVVTISFTQSSETEVKISDLETQLADLRSATADDINALFTAVDYVLFRE